jgi:hypothetical protein
MSRYLITYITSLPGMSATVTRVFTASTTADARERAVEFAGIVRARFGTVLTPASIALL